MAGLILGAISGSVQYLLLARFTKAILSGDYKTKTIFTGAVQFFIPLAVLLCIAMILPGSLVWAGIGMAGALLCCAGVQFIRRCREAAGSEKEGDK